MTKTGFVIATERTIFVVVIVVAGAFDTITHRFVNSACLTGYTGRLWRLGAVHHIARLW